MTGRKLSEFDVLAIRSDDRSAVMLARVYGVTPTMISRVQLGQAWQHLPGARPPRYTQTDRGGRHPDRPTDAKYARTSRNYLYSAWLKMIQRCTDPKHDAWEWYGGRGIFVCPKWLNSFELFVDDIGDRPSDRHSLDRRNNQMGYSPENCRWATAKEQAANRRARAKERQNIIRVDGLSLTALAKLHGIKRGTIKYRYQSGKRGADLVAPLSVNGQTVLREAT